MTDKEKFLEQLLIAYKDNPIFKNHPVFRDNIIFLTQVPLRNLPAHTINESINRMKDFLRYESPAPPRANCIS